MSDNAENMDNFDIGFHNFILSSLQYEYCRRNRLSISDDLQQRIDEATRWLNGLTDEEYSRLIH